MPACLEFAALDAILITCALGLALPARRRLVEADEQPVDECRAELVTAS
jgi:hypothetical protein